MKKFAVIGNPIEHSRSPQIHTAFGAQTGIALSYEKLLAPLDGFNAAVTAFFAQGGTGLNVTVPFKEEAFALCGALTNRAKAAKAVNTLWMENGILHGDNTDGQGLVMALNRLFKHQFSLQHASVLLLGAGGAARGVVLPLLEAGVSRIVIANRNVQRATLLKDSLQLDKIDVGLSAKLATTQLNALTGQVDVVINATSAGLQGEGIQLPESLHFKYAYDMVYGKPSTVLATANARGVPSADGLGMLIYQAAEAFFVWNKVRPSEAICDTLFDRLHPQ